jgi:hypothetical protein
LNENGTTKSWWKRKAEKTDSGLIHAWDRGNIIAVETEDDRQTYPGAETIDLPTIKLKNKNNNDIASGYMIMWHACMLREFT